MRRQRQASGGNGRTGDHGRGAVGRDTASAARSGAEVTAPHLASPTPGPGMTPQALLALQRNAGNAATARALRGRLPAAEGVAGTTRAPRPAPAVLPSLEELPESSAATRLPAVLPALEEAAEESEEGAKNAPPRAVTTTRPVGRARVGRSAGGSGASHPPLGLPPYLRELRAAGLSTAYGLTGHEFVSTALGTVVGRSDGTVAEIREELAGRPETFYGQGRSFAVEGPEGKGGTTSPSPSPGTAPTCPRPSSPPRPRRLRPRPCNRPRPWPRC